MWPFVEVLAMNSYLPRVFASLCFALGLSAVACGGGAGGGGAEAVSRGQKLVTDLGCKDCHGSDLAGDTNPIEMSMSYASNLTPDADTGLGNADWPDDKIKNAIREGGDDAKLAECDEMPRFPDLTDGELSDIVAYLRSVPAVKKEVPESTCAP
jgi:mono/diheme cytochrome c family protein